MNKVVDELRRHNSYNKKINDEVDIYFPVCDNDEVEIILTIP